MKARRGKSNGLAAGGIWTTRGLLLCFALVLPTLLCSSSAYANPQGMTVVQGSANAVANGSQFNITASQNAVINWQSFNIAAGETTTFQQPSSMSVVWNRILDTNPSQIWGNINANGIVVLMNQNGFYFGPNSVVNASGFIATSAMTFPPAEIGGGMWTYQGPPPAASIVNYGQIKVSDGGSLFMIAEKIENHGILSAPDGTLGLYAGKSVLISERPDGRGLCATVTLPEGSIDNTGKLIADGGTIALRAQVVNQNGLIQANSVRNQNGVIELVASDTVNLGPNSLLQANGDTSSSSDGGQIMIKSAGTFVDDPSSRIEVRGGAAGGNGGSVEISATSMTTVNSQLDGTAQAGWRGGRLLLDPYDIILGNSGSDSAGSGTINAGDSPGSTLQLNVNSAFIGFSQITLQAMHDISLASGTVWDLVASTGLSLPGCTLTLLAGNNIIFGSGSSIQAGDGWSVNLSAGVDFSSPTFSTRPGIGGIYLNGGPADANGTAPNLNGAIQATDGNITLNAGHEVLVGQGYIRTVSGGNISITTGDGDVNAGTDNATYDYSRAGYVVSSLGLGGIGTADGGNVTINSGHDILSLTANIGAFGANPGDVTLTAAHDIMGYFMLRNGVGTLNAGNDVGTPNSGASFGLISGGWTINAANDLYVNEVYNPNGSLNANNMRVPTGQYSGNVDSSGDPIAVPVRSQYLFDYAPDAYVNLNGGNSVQLLGNNLAHTSGNAARPAIYAPILNITAGAGGVVLDNDVVLYPSAQGSLNIQTTGGGSLVSGTGRYCQLIVSDSGNPDYTTFATGHAVTPLHLNDSGYCVTLDISGDIENLFLSSPAKADIHVGGDAVNFSFQGQNLHANDVTQLHIDGDYFSRSDHTSVILQDDPTLALFNQIFNDPLLSMNPGLDARLSYDANTHTLTVQGILTEADLNFLLHPTTYVLDPTTGLPKVDAKGNPIVVSTTFTTDTTDLLQLYAATQDIPTSPLAHNGLQIGGPGEFDITAHNMDLGISAGIRSVGPQFNPALVSLSAEGSDLFLQLSGNLEMGSSSIASFNGGSITVDSRGQIDVGSQNSYTSDDTPKGIYTDRGGDVTVHAVGNVNVNGSRIGTYDGGDISVISDTGTVDTGSGGGGFFYVPTSYVDPTTGKLNYRNDQFFGSGIVATTRSDSDTLVGNILVQAKNVLIGVGGLFQIPFNDPIVDSTGTSIIGNINPITGVITVFGQPSASFTLSGTAVLDSGGNVIGYGQSLVVTDVIGTARRYLNQMLSGGESDLHSTGHNTVPVAVQNFFSQILKIYADEDVTGDNTTIMAVNMDIKARNVTGLNLVSRWSTTIHGSQTVDVKSFSVGPTTVSGQNVTGQYYGGLTPDITGDSSGAKVIDASGSDSATKSAFEGVSTTATEQSVQSADKTLADQTVAQNDEDDEKKKRSAGKGPALMRRVGRVTVILPKA